MVAEAGRLPYKMDDSKFHLLNLVDVGGVGVSHIADAEKSDRKYSWSTTCDTRIGLRSMCPIWKHTCWTVETGKPLGLNGLIL